MRILSWLFALLACISTGAQTHPVLLPEPQIYQKSDRCFTMGRVRLVTPVLEEELTRFITESGGTLAEEASRKIEVVLVPAIREARLNQQEAYTLSVRSRSVRIEATAEQGVYWALQTLRQLGMERKGRMVFQGCEIIDWPAFRIRGFMQDVGRTYISLPELKREIAMLSRYKINVFHWHLTENQSWRLESKLFPMLNDSVNTTRMPGCYYTLEEARELVEFCRMHGMMLIPEIDMPGHSAAFQRTFRHDMQSPEGMKILKLLIEEVCTALDVPYLHIGTDEVGFTNPGFVPEMVRFVRSLGKKVISWNPGWHYQPGEIDMTHLWSFRGKAQPGIPAIDSRYHYLNHFDTFADIVALYNSRIGNVEEGNEDIAGVILALWHDRFIPDEQRILLENGFYPNMLAIAERAWKGGGSEYFDKNGTNLIEGTEEFKAFAGFEERMLWHKKHCFQDYPFGYVRQTDVRWRITDAFPNDGELERAFPPEQALQDSYEYEGKSYHTRTVNGAGIYLRHVWGMLEKGIPVFYPKAQKNHTAYAYTWVYSPADQEVGLLAEFQNYSRSEMDLPPRPGTWDYKGSRIWINGAEILPPVWSATHSVRSNEIPLGNENCVARPPLRVALHKGWNKVLLKLPVGEFSLPETRLIKWMFTAVFVTLDGRDAVEGLVYASSDPEKQ